MAKNRSMAIKFAKAKKCAMQEIKINAQAEMCAHIIPRKTNYTYHDMYISDDKFFYSKYAIQRRIDVLVGKHYPVEDFAKKYNDIYKYLIKHTVPEARKHFGTVIC